MNNFFVAINRCWVRTAFFLSHISKTLLIFLSACVFCFIPGIFSKHSFLEDSVVYLSAKLHGIKERQAEVALITVDDALVEEWQSDIYQADQLSLLLANVLHSPNTKIGLLFDRRLPLDANIVDSLASQSQSDLGELGQRIRQKRILMEMLSDSRVVVGVKRDAVLTSPIFDLRASSKVEQQLSTLIPLAKPIQSSKLLSVDTSNQYFSTYLLGDLSRPAADVWFQYDDQLHASYIAALCLSGEQLNPNVRAELDLLQIRATDQKCLGEIDLPLSPVVGAYDRLPFFQVRHISLSLDEALALSTFPELVLLSNDASLHLNRQVADIVHSLKYEIFLILPRWLGIAQALIFLLLLTYILFFSYKLSSTKLRLGVFVSLLLVLYISSLSFAYFYYYLIPLTTIFFASIIVATVTSWRHIVVRETKHKQSNLAESISSVADILESNEEFDEALMLLEHYPDKQLAVKKIVSICDDFERDPENVITVKQALESMHDSIKSHPLIKQKLAKLKTDLSHTRTKQAIERKASRHQVSLPKSLGRYQIEKELGRGAVGIVYLGFDPAIARKVAIKTLDSRLFSTEQVDDLKQRFFREAEAVGRLNHPNIVSIYDLGEEGDLAYIAMDYVDGVALSEHVVPETLLPVEDVYRIAHDVASALAYAHEKQIVHRDIKPSNIMYGKSEHVVKVADFGIARLLDNSRTATGEILGSPLYMAPEQLQGRKVGVTADIFSLGVMLYQLLTAHLPFDADNLAALTYEIIHSKHKSVRSHRKGLPASAARIVNQCLQKAPENRYQSAQELVLVLRKAIKRDFPDLARELSVF